MSDFTRLPGLKAGHQIITPTCRQNRGATPAFLEAAERLRVTYDNYARSPDNAGVNWHLVLIRDDSNADTAERQPSPREA